MQCENFSSRIFAISIAVGWNTCVYSLTIVNKSPMGAHAVAGCIADLVVV